MALISKLECILILVFQYDPTASTTPTTISTATDNYNTTSQLLLLLKPLNYDSVSLINDSIKWSSNSLLPHTTLALYLFKTFE